MFKSFVESIYFSMNLQVSGNGTIDREKQPFLRFIAVAADIPQGGPNQKKASVPVSLSSTKQYYCITFY